MGFFDQVNAAVDDFAQMREDQLDRTIAAESARVVSDLQLRAGNKIREDFATADPGNFNANDQLVWFKQQAAEITNKLGDDESRAVVGKAIQQAQFNFMSDATQFELKSFQNKEKLGLDDLSNNYARMLSDRTRKVDDVLEDFQNTMATLSPRYQDNREVLKEKVEELQLFGGREKIRRLGDLVAEGKASVDEFESLRKSFNESVLFGSIDVKGRREITKALDSELDSAKSKGAVNQKKFVKARGSEYVIALREGKARELGFEQTVFANRDDPAIAKIAQEISVYEENQGFWDAVQDGDLKTMIIENEKIQQKSAAAKQDVFGKRRAEAILTQEALDKARDMPTGQLVANNKQIQFVKAQGYSSGDMTPYLRSLEETNESLGGDPVFIEPLDDEEVANINFMLDNSDIPVIKQWAIDQKQQWSAKFSTGISAYNNVFSQILFENAGGELSTESLALNYADSDNPADFDLIMGASRTDMQEVSKSIGLITEEKVSDFKEEIRKAIAPNVTAELMRVPRDPDAFNATYQDLAFQVAGRLISRGKATISSAPQKVREVLFDRHQKFFTKGARKNIPLLGERNIFTAKVAVNIPNKTKFTHKFIEKKLKSGSLNQNLLRAFGKRVGGGISLAGDPSEILNKDLMPPSIYNKLQMQSVLDNARAVTSPDGRGVMLVVEGDNFIMPLYTNKGIVQMSFDDFDELEDEVLRSPVTGETTFE